MKLLTYMGLTATKFADEIGVQRSGISHILSGRNQPSYDFILKIMKRYPELSLDWLILGKGAMMKDINKPQDVRQKDLFDNAEIMTQHLSEKSKPGITENKGKAHVTNVTTFEQVIVFYSDGTCKRYISGKQD